MESRRRENTYFYFKNSASVKTINSVFCGED
jgi:hypothetical protein